MNSMFLRSVFLLASLLGLPLVVIPAARQQETPPNLTVRSDQHEARGFGTDSARVDSQITMRIPDAQADAVYQYLVDKYVGQTGILAEQFPGIHLSGQKLSDVSVFRDEYFDTPALQLFK
ncbi:MAG TPA: hypothetical protein VM509_06865, partial [Planctomycetota bacterium]|nr:hypothetical protein [Planctomycetota bacterium]